MKKLKRVALGIFGFVMLSVPFAFAQAQTLSVQSISPGTTVFVSGKLAFTIGGSGFLPLFYQLTDSAPHSSISPSDITGLGNFSWVPTASDVGTHVFSISAIDSSGVSASTTQTITVVPAPSVSVSSISPSSSIMPGTKLTFSVSTSGFTNPSYIVGDSFNDSTVGDSNIDASGNFSWTPVDIGQDGEHTITIYANDSLGHNASVNVPVLVGPGAALVIQSLSPGASVSPLQTLSFIVNGSEFTPNSFSVSDNFPSSTLNNTDINTSGAFYWVPQASDVGTHVLTITGTVGTFGQSTSTTQTITVVGPNDATAAAATTSNPTSTASTSLSALQAELVQLQSQLQSNAASAAPNTSAFTFTTSLYSGMQDTDVTELQNVLSKLGFFSSVPNGYFGPLTLSAVEKFQAAHDLPQIGVVGPSTRALLNSLLASSQTTSSTSASTSADSGTFEDPIGFGQSGADVLALQKRLATLGFFSGAPTGYFGEATLAAVIQFQNAKGIPPVDQLGDATRAALNQ